MTWADKVKRKFGRVRVIFEINNKKSEYPSELKKVETLFEKLIPGDVVIFEPEYVYFVYTYRNDWDRYENDLSEEDLDNNEIIEYFKLIHIPLNELEWYDRRTIAKYTKDIDTIQILSKDGFWMVKEIIASRGYFLKKLSTDTQLTVKNIANDGLDLISKYNLKAKKLSKPPRIFKNFEEAYNQYTSECGLLHLYIKNYISYLEWRDNEHVVLESELNLPI